MNDELRQIVIDKLRREEELPREWARELFPPERREYELVYYGKEREEDILADTLAVPLQPVRTFGAGEDGWRNILIFGDNLQALKRLLEMKQRGELTNSDGTTGVRLVYIDPPFAAKKEFRGDQEQKAYEDKKAGAEFVEFVRKRLVILRELLADNGALLVHLDQKKGHYIKVILDEVFGEHNFRNEIVVRRTQKNYVEREYIQSLNLATDSIYVYARSGSTQFSPVYKGVAVPETWHSLDAPNWSGTRPNLVYELFGKLPPKGRCWAWEPERAKVAIEAGDLRPNPRTGKPEYRIPARDRVICTSHWDDLVAYAFSSGYPTEKSEKILARIIQMASAEGDLVLDAFAGSGTTLAVAEKLGRRWIGIDCGKLAIYTVQKRLLTLKSEIGNKGKPLAPRPFTLYNAGLYDFATLRQLPWADWRFFALQLFGCRDEPHEIGGLKLDGRLRGASVLVFNHHERPGARVDEETVRSIHAALGDKIGARFFIIAPRGAFDFQQDYLDLDGVRYYALRIPYSVINELHHRDFTALRQPNDETAVNDTVDAVGFDFIQPPEVAWTAGVGQREGQMINEAFLQIEGFESRARIRGQDRLGGVETFSMLMLDFDYDGEVFSLDAVHYAGQMQTEGWRAWFPVEGLGRQVMAVFMDIYGNEAREVIPREKFGDS
jgi:site-specific DNA-methyltransferase (adenine-specific)/adenine-specific DNA-methyltransferase